MSGQPTPGTGIHATAVVYGETGVLMLGRSGSGKSALALALLGRARDAGAFGALIADDRVWVRRAGRRLMASGAPRVAGLIERRMAGLVTTPHEPAALVGLAVELSGRGRTWPRLPDDRNILTLEGVDLPRLALDSSQCASDQALAVDERLAIVTADRVKRKGISLEHCPAVHKNGRLVGSRPASSTLDA
jgi:HPr kinase/phosphorylase